jgi:hypothetical protein
MSTDNVIQLDAAAAARTWSAVREAVQRASRMGLQIVEAYAQIGDMLIELKARTPRGEFMRKCVEAFNPQMKVDNFHLQAARIRAGCYMRLAVNRDIWMPHNPQTLTEAMKLCRKRRSPSPSSSSSPPPTLDRADLSMTAQQKLDAAITRYRRELEAEYASKHADLRASYHAQVYAEIERRLPDHARQEIDNEREKARRAKELEGVWHQRMQRARSGVRLFMEDWRTLAGCLHPDRAPLERRDQFNRATDIVLRVKTALERAEYEKW